MAEPTSAIAPSYKLSATSTKLNLAGLENVGVRATAAGAGPAGPTMTRKEGARRLNTMSSLSSTQAPVSPVVAPVVPPIVNRKTGSKSSTASNMPGDLGRGMDSPMSFNSDTAPSGSMRSRLDSLSAQSPSFSGPPAPRASIGGKLIT
jgi:hypothetical protein